MKILLHFEEGCDGSEKKISYHAIIIITGTEKLNRDDSSYQKTSCTCLVLLLLIFVFVVSADEKPMVSTGNASLTLTLRIFTDALVCKCSDIVMVMAFVPACENFV